MPLHGLWTSGTPPDPAPPITQGRAQRCGSPLRTASFGMQTSTRCLRNGAAKRKSRLGMRSVLQKCRRGGSDVSLHARARHDAVLRMFQVGHGADTGPAPGMGAAVAPIRVAAADAQAAVRTSGRSSPPDVGLSGQHRPAKSVNHQSPIIESFQLARSGIEGCGDSPMGRFADGADSLIGRLGIHD
jgi:hypothetical protein